MHLDTAVGAGEEKLSTIGKWNLGCRNKEGIFDELTLNTRQGGTRVSQCRVKKKAVWVKEQHVQRPCAGKSLGRGHEAW